MFESVVVATDGSASAGRAIDAALDLARRFDATVHALYVVDEGSVTAMPEDVREEVRGALDARGQDALEGVAERNADRPRPVALETAVRVGRPAAEIVAHARDVDANAVALGTRGRSGEHSYLLGSVAERVVRSAPVPVLTVRQLASGGS